MQFLSLHLLHFKKAFVLSFGGFTSRKMEEMLDSFADRISKPRLCLTDKMLISLGKFLHH
jgi:hypothetical protein